tara:strand:+ start:364 stop:639 length:276 start_codon:yes stop_codon:yes gene_type:complete
MNKHTPTFIFLILCLLVLLFNWYCISMLQVSKYEFIDMYGKKHLYEEKIKGLNKTVTYYCQKHHEWETINIRYTRDGVKYRVVMNELIKGE